MNSQAETTTILTQLHEEVREVFVNHIPESYAKDDALENLDAAFENAREAVRELSA